MENFYVYVYYDPRNLNLFYVGKGRGSRKTAHFGDTSDSDKTRILKEIERDGVAPMIRVIARDLTEEEALLIESTLIWEHYPTLTNKNKGHKSSKFRPKNTLHQELPGFDYINNIYYVNVAEGDHRNWDDCNKFGFLCAGGDPKWSDPLVRLNKGDVVIAYQAGKGYVGVGIVTSPRQKAIDFEWSNGHKLIEIKDKLIQPNIFENANNDELAQYCVGINWKKSVDRDDAIWKKNAGLFTSQQVVASLLNQKSTIEYVSAEFGIDIFSFIE